MRRDRPTRRRAHGAAAGAAHPSGLRDDHHDVVCLFLQDWRDRGVEKSVVGAKAVDARGHRRWWERRVLTGGEQRVLRDVEAWQIQNIQITARFRQSLPQADNRRIELR